ncbi:MAG: phospholipase [Chitinophagaceae bacterium]|nr:phospholipase [Chitinophagaceae bacterium]
MKILQLIFLVLLISSCSKTKNPDEPKIYRFSESIVVDGLTRTYTVNLPPDYYDHDSYSLVLAFHGGGGDAVQFESTSRLSEKANSSKFIVVYPNGVKSDGPLKAQTWNAGGCCDYAVQQNINDVKFVSMLIDKLTTSFKINSKKVYATGHSNGGMLSYRLACELSNKIAAIAPNGCTMVVTQPCSALRAVSVLHMHSVNDSRVPYTGGEGAGVVDAYLPPLDSVLNVWSLKNSCNVQAQVLTNNAQFLHSKWSDCNQNTSIEYYLTQDGGHGWPGGLPGGANSDIPSTYINANDLLWAFFQKYQLP